ncbi:MAG: hypothetical protein GXY53_04480 [Desulfobulbus sp.]|nr:hypothetical protein [Desulfobulbus sp.]
MAFRLCRLFLSVSFTVTVLLALSAAVTAISAEGWRTPSPGDPERAQIMDALRTELAQFHPHARQMVFVVRELCISSTSGWLSADPRSADGKNSYETVNATLKRHAQRWVVEEIACGEEDCPPGTDAEALRRRVGPKCP